jgi:hypothetical protein
MLLEQGILAPIMSVEVEDNGSSIANLHHVFDAYLANDADDPLWHSLLADRSMKPRGNSPNREVGGKCVNMKLPRLAGANKISKLVPWLPAVCFPSRNRSLVQARMKW